LFFRAALCGSFAIKETTGYAKRIISLRQRNGVFVTCGERMLTKPSEAIVMAPIAFSENLRIWSIDQVNSKLKVQDTALGKLRREFTGMCISLNDDILYAGTMSGDIVKIRLNCPPHPEEIEIKSPNLIGSFALHLPKKPLGKDCQKYQFGVREILILPNDKGLVIGAGDGTVDFVVERDVKMKEYGSPTWPMLRSLKKFKVGSAVTSLQLFRNNVLLIGTEDCEIYSFSNDELTLLKTCHTNKVNDIAFP
jgi:cilia- and flagella-associated protein 52